MFDPKMSLDEPVTVGQGRYNLRSNVVKRKVNKMSTVTDYLKKFRKDMEDNTVAVYWVVLEYTPAQEAVTHDDLGRRARKIIVSPKFEVLSEAEEWLNEHEPDYGKSLYIQKYRRVRKVTYVDYAVKE